MKTERESFDLWFKKNFHDLHEAICCGDLVAKNYKKAMFKAWKASAQREGYVVVPKEPTCEMVSEGFKEMCVVDMRDFSDESAVNIYKAMLEAQEK